MTRATSGQPEQIATARSARVVASRKLLRRAVRRSEGAFLVDGPQAVREALRFHGDGSEHPHRIAVRVHEVYVEDGAQRRHADLLVAAANLAIRVLVCEPKAIAALSEASTPQGILARCASLTDSFEELLAASASPRLLAVPIDVRDPGNLGTIIRCADAAGADGVAVLGDSVDIYNSKAVRASVGSLFHLPIVTHAEPIAAIESVQAAGLRVIATEGEASMSLDDAIDDGLLKVPTAWLFGNEAHGLPDAVAERADLRVRIPIGGLAESLNLSTAAAVCLFASAREQRRAALR